MSISHTVYVSTCSASERVSVVSEYQSRQKAAMDNKRRAEGKGGVKYQPPHGRGQPHPPPRKNKAEQVKGCEFTMYVLICLCVLVYMYITIHLTCFVVSIATGISS